MGSLTAQNGTCPTNTTFTTYDYYTFSGTPASPSLQDLSNAVGTNTSIWALPDNATPVSDWYALVKWKYNDNDGSFRGLYDDESTDEPKLPLYDSDLTTYVGNQGNQNVTYTGYLPLGPNETWCFQAAADIAGEGDDDGDTYVRLKTATAYSPKNIAIKANGIGFTQAEIKWEKGTHAPDNKHQYILIAEETGGTETVRDTISGLSRAYVFKGLKDGTAYSFKVQTYMKSGSLSFTSGTKNWSYNAYSASTSTAVSVSGSTQNFTFTLSQGIYPTKVRLVWSAISGNEGSQIKVERNIVTPRSTSSPNLNDFEERVILSAASTSYEDLDAISGLNYNYRLSVLDGSNAVISKFQATGWRRPNGVIRGKIQTSNSTGVSGVRICAKAKNPIPVAGASNTADPDSGYCVNSTISGRFEIRNIYYFDSATFVITPYLEDHSFDPPRDEAVLDLSTSVQSGFVFTDTTAISLSGKVYFPLASTFGATGTDTIPVQDAIILIDTTDFGIRTDANGNWSYAVLDTGSYKFRVEYLNHTFDNSLISVPVQKDRNNLNFVDLQVDSVKIRTQDGCGDPVADSVVVKVSYDIPGGSSYLTKTFATDAQGLSQIKLPATKFKFVVAANNPALDAASADPNIKPQFLSAPISLDLSYRDSTRFLRQDSVFVTRADSTVVLPDTSFVIPGGKAFVGIQQDSLWRNAQPSANFLYYGPIRVSVNWEDAGAEIVNNCKASGPATANDSVIIVQSGSRYRVTISIFDAIKNCPVDTGKITLFDYVSDRERTPITFPISNGKVQYEVTAGTPNTANGGSYPYQKPFFMSVEAGSRNAEATANWVLVEGAEEITPTFTSRSPQMPDIIVHDPPGDASYAWIEKGSSRTVAQKVQYYTFENGRGFYVDATIGGAGSSPSGGEFKAGIQIQYEGATGIEGSSSKAYETTYEFTENFSTSAEPFWTGHDGDVYIGKATNQRFSVAKVLLFDNGTCTASIQDKPNLELVGIATTFHYTEKHIKRILIPQLKFLELTLKREASRTPDQSRKDELVGQADSFQVDQMNWKNILANNAKNRDDSALYKENISFSAGAPFERVVTTSADTVVEQEYFEYTENDTKLGAAWENTVFLWTVGNIGYATKSRIVTLPTDKLLKDKNKDSTISSSMTVGYVFDDLNFGDYFSVDILEDKRSGFPAFRVFAGASSCPHEPGTQARDKATISVFPPRIDNVDPEEEASFSILLTNKSESRETRDYYVRAHPQNNPHGAVITLGGFEIMTDQMQFTLDSTAIELPLQIAKGPRSSNYERIAISIIPQCEWDAFQNNGDVTGADTVYFSVTFESECSSVAITNPANNWYINAETGNTLVVDLGGYDTDNENLESITLQYRSQGEDWTDAQTVLVADLINDLYRMSLDFENLPNGRYWLRAKASCNSGGDLVYSPEVSGVVEKGSIAPFGLPFPNDGFLRAGQELFVSFDQPMDTAISNRVNYASAPMIRLIQSDDLTKVPFTLRWSNDSSKLYFDIDTDFVNDAANRGKKLKATVSGLRSGVAPNYEPQTATVDWEVLLRVSPVSWEPAKISKKVFAGESSTFLATLKSVTGVPKDFKITKLPSWLLVGDSTGKVFPYNDASVQFAISAELGVGVFEDTVTAMIDGIPEYLVIKLVSEARRPNWTVNPADYTYSMSMVVAMSLDPTDTNLSRDDRDVVAAFFNGEVRGVANLEYVEQFNKYLAFITVYSNIPANEEITFNLWRASTGAVNQAEETFYFSSEQMYGRIGDPEILHPGPSFTGIPLQKGWNWISINVENPDNTIHNLLNSLTSPKVGNDVTVKRKDGQTATFTQIATPIIFSNQWAGNLQVLDNKQAYLIHLSKSADTLYVPGNPITNFSPIDVLSGWNWIGFQPQLVQPVDQALGSLNLRNRDILKSQEAFSEYHKGSDRWYGPLQFMEPGKGYKLKLKDGKTYNDLTYSRVGLKDFEVDHTRFESSMTLVGSIGIETLDERLETLDERLLVGAFIDDTCRGYGFLEYVKFLQEYRVVFSLHGNADDIGKAVSFKVYDTQSGQEFIPDNDTEVYVSDRILGEMLAPYVLFERLALPEAGYYLEQNYPNPYDSRTTIRFILPQSEHVTLSIYDQFGKLIAQPVNESRQAGEHSVIFDASALPSGIYHYSIQAGEYRAGRKMVKF